MARSDSAFAGVYERPARFGVLHPPAPGRRRCTADVPAGDRCGHPGLQRGRDSIEAVLRSLLKQTRLPDQIHVIVNNTKDDTVRARREVRRPADREAQDSKWRARPTDHRGLRPRHRREPRQEGRRPELRLRADPEADYLLGVDGDTTLAGDAVEKLEAEIASDTRIGGISAIYSIDDTTPDGLIAKLLIAGQRTQFAAFNMQNMLTRPQHGRPRRPVLDLLHAGPPRRDGRNHQQTPWVNDSEVEDSLLSPADQVRRLPHQDLRPGPRRRRRHDHPPLARRPAGQVELRRHRPDVARPARRHQGPAVPPQPPTALGREHRHGHQHLHPHRLRPAARRLRCPSTPSCSRPSG